MLTPVDGVRQPYNNALEVGLIQEHTFQLRDLVAGHLALDLVNTVTARNAEPVDWLTGYPRLLQWASLTGEFDPGVLQALDRRSAGAPDTAAAALDATRELREAVHDVTTAIIRHDAPPADGLRRIERTWKDAVSVAELTLVAGSARLQLTVDRSGLAYLHHELALRSVELLQTLPLARTRICPGPRCGWLFIDHSRGGQRRWCDMATCGNAAKSTRHYQRRRRPIR
jgi:predicted RNA-binding Zn ribbon-like protein